jgi:hypothetical protein
MTGTPHIKFAELTDYAEGRVASDIRAKMDIHLSSCDRCSGELAEVRQIVTLMQTDSSEDAPRYARLSAVDLFRSRARTKETSKETTKESPLRRVLAKLVFDSLQPAFAAGLRGSGGARQLLFEAGDNELHLEIGAIGDDWQITGQVVGPCEEGNVILEAGSRRAEANLDDLCEFGLPPQPAGVYALRLTLGGLELVIPELTLGDPQS